MPLLPARFVKDKRRRRLRALGQAPDERGLNLGFLGRLDPLPGRAPRTTPTRIARLGTAWRQADEQGSRAAV